jgi:hypothetical protein
LSVIFFRSGLSANPNLGKVHFQRKQDKSLVVNAYSTAAFTVNASGTGPLNYQWSFNSTNIAGANSNILTISNVVQTNLGAYAVTISNPFARSQVPTRHSL